MIELKPKLKTREYKKQKQTRNEPKREKKHTLGHPRFDWYDTYETDGKSIFSCFRLARSLFCVHSTQHIRLLLSLSLLLSVILLLPHSVSPTILIHPYTIHLSFTSLSLSPYLNHTCLLIRLSVYPSVSYDLQVVTQCDSFAIMCWHFSKVCSDWLFNELS